MKVTLQSSVSGRQVFLHVALQNAVDEYERVMSGFASIYLTTMKKFADAKAAGESR